MFFIGAHINFSEFTDTDMLLQHQLLISKLRHKYSDELDSRRPIYYLPRSNTMSLVDDKEPEEKGLLINVMNEMKMNSQLLAKTVSLCNSIRSKIRSDHLVSPLKIFWVTSNFTLIGEIGVILASSAVIGLGSVLRNGSMNFTLTQNTTRNITNTTLF